MTTPSSSRSEATARQPRWALQRVRSAYEAEPTATVRDLAVRTGLRTALVRVCLDDIATDMKTG